MLIVSIFKYNVDDVYAMQLHIGLLESLEPCVRSASIRPAQYACCLSFDRFVKNPVGDAFPIRFFRHACSRLALLGAYHAFLRLARARFRARDYYASVIGEVCAAFVKM